MLYTFIVILATMQCQLKKKKENKKEQLSSISTHPYKQKYLILNIQVNHYASA